jgi:hypothetical protein
LGALKRSEQRAAAEEAEKLAERHARVAANRRARELEQAAADRLG